MESMFRRKMTYSNDPTKEAEREAEEEARLADPDAPCKSMWTPPHRSYAVCQRPIPQSVPHQHRSIDRGYRLSAEWAQPGNYRNEFEKVQIAANAADWLAGKERAPL